MTLLLVLWLTYHENIYGQLWTWWSQMTQRLRRRQYDPVIIERTIGLVLGPSTALFEPFLKHYTLNNKAMGTIWWALSKPPQRCQGPDLPSPLTLVSRDSFGHQTWARISQAEHSRSYSDVAKYTFDIIRGYYVSVLQKLTGYRRIPCQEWVSPRGVSRAVKRIFLTGDSPIPCQFL